MLKIPKQNECIRGFRMDNSGHSRLEISHLMYANDTLVMCDATLEQLQHQRVILTVFESVSGLHVNWRKSLIFPVYRVPNIKILGGVMGCEIGCLHTTYLGLSLCAKNNPHRFSKGL